MQRPFYAAACPLSMNAIHQTVFFSGAGAPQFQVPQESEGFSGFLQSPE
tara:strand:- start:1 stop:147 length:147 start_codon:yes stop_codon:yes gene_type:complete